MPSPALGFCFACYPSLKRSMLEACLAPAALSWTAVSRKSTKNTGPQRARPAMWATVPPGWFYANGFVTLNRDSIRYGILRHFQQSQGGACAKHRMMTFDKNAQSKNKLYRLQWKSMNIGEDEDPCNHRLIIRWCLLWTFLGIPEWVLSEWMSQRWTCPIFHAGCTVW